MGIQINATTIQVVETNTEYQGYRAIGLLQKNMQYRLNASQFIHCTIESVTNLPTEYYKACETEYNHILK